MDLKMTINIFFCVRTTNLQTCKEIYLSNKIYKVCEIMNTAPFKI